VTWFEQFAACFFSNITDVIVLSLIRISVENSIHLDFQKLDWGLRVTSQYTIFWLIDWLITKKIARDGLSPLQLRGLLFFFCPDLYPSVLRMHLALQSNEQLESKKQTDFACIVLCNVSGPIASSLYSAVCNENPLALVCNVWQFCYLTYNAIFYSSVSISLANS